MRGRFIEISPFCCENAHIFFAASGFIVSDEIWFVKMFLEKQEICLNESIFLQKIAGSALRSDGVGAGRSLSDFI